MDLHKGVETEHIECLEEVCSASRSAWSRLCRTVPPKRQQGVEVAIVSVAPTAPCLSAWLQEAGELLPGSPRILQNRVMSSRHRRCPAFRSHGGSRRRAARFPVCPPEREPPTRWRRYVDSSNLGIHWSFMAWWLSKPTASGTLTGASLRTRWVTGSAIAAPAARLPAPSRSNNLAVKRVVAELGLRGWRAQRRETDALGPTERTPRSWPPRPAGRCQAPARSGRSTSDLIKKPRAEGLGPIISCAAPRQALGQRALSDPASTRHHR